jgi:hypothetical protein
MEDVKQGTVTTYENLNGDPIIRKCGNCLFWKGINGTVGYCEKLPLLFAYSLAENCWAMTAKFTLCEKHVLRNEKILATQSKEITYDVDYMSKHNQNGEY